MKGALYAAGVMLALLGPLGLPPAPPAPAAPARPAVIRTCGVHLLHLTDGQCRWLGPGDHATWAADQKTILCEAAHVPLDAAPMGPVYTVGVDTRQARSLGRAEDKLCAVQVGPSGKWFVALQAASDGQATLSVRRSADHLAIAPEPALGPLRARCRQMYAWLPGRDVLLWVAVGKPEQTGLWQWPVPDGKPQRLLALDQLDGLWPAPDGRQVAVRSLGRISVLQLARPDEPAKVLWPAQPEVDVGSVGWDADSKGLWLHTLNKSESWVRHRTLDGGTEQPWPIPGDVISYLSWHAGQAAVVGRLDGRLLVRSLNLTDGKLSDLAAIDSEVPLRPDPYWAAAPPDWSADGKSLLLSLGRTDRWGIVDSDRIKVGAIDVSGKAVTTARSTRNVGPSGVVFSGDGVRFMGRARPHTDSLVVGDTRPGAFRWTRPCPPRWVVLHHTATISDGVSVNSLTGGSDGLLAQSYADISPHAWVKAEPNTIGVHYLVLRSGLVLQLVEEKYIARHAGTGQWLNRGPIYDFNAETIGIEIVAKGNDFTPGQVRSVGRLVADICRRNDIPLRHILGETFTPGVLYHMDFAGGLRGKNDPAGWPWGTMMRNAEAWLANKP